MLARCVAVHFVRILECGFWYTFWTLHKIEIVGTPTRVGGFPDGYQVDKSSSETTALTWWFVLLTMPVDSCEVTSWLEMMTITYCLNMYVTLQVADQVWRVCKFKALHHFITTSHSLHYFRYIRCISLYIAVSLHHYIAWHRLLHYSPSLCSDRYGNQAIMWDMPNLG